MAASKHEEALALAESLLEAIEMERVNALGAVRKGVRLARLTDDADASSWLLWELHGYPATDGVLNAEAREWAYMSGRAVTRQEANEDWPLYRAGENHRVNVTSLSRLMTIQEEGARYLEPESYSESGDLLRLVVAAPRVQRDVLTAVHLWAGGVYHKLRFGRAVETAFDVVRSEVDESISSLVPDAMPKLSAAFENASSDNQEQWANAASTCRRLLKAAADALRPPGDDVDGRKMDDDHYINRLVDWITHQSESEKLAAMVAADLEYLGRRLDAAHGAGHKGAHAEVSRFDASRFVTGTYLLLGDILRLSRAPHPS